MVMIYMYFAFACLSLYYLQYDWPAIVVVQSFWFSLGFSVIILLLFKDQKFKLNHPVLLFLGKISYGLYLSHFFSFYLLDHFGLIELLPGKSGGISLLNFLFRFSLCLIISTCLSYILHLTIENPFQNLGKRLIIKLNGQVN